MPSIYDLKPRFQALLRPLVFRLAKAGVTANQVTVAALFLSAIGGALVALAPTSAWPLAMMPVILLVRMGLNAIDGMLAREFGQKSRTGAVLNELCDVISDLLLYLPLARIPELQTWPVVIFAIAGLLVEFAGVVALQVESQRRYEGPMGKSDRAFWVGLLTTLLACLQSCGKFPARPFCRKKTGTGTARSNPSHRERAVGSQDDTLSGDTAAPRRHSGE